MIHLQESNSKEISRENQQNKSSQEGFRNSNKYKANRTEFEIQEIGAKHSSLFGIRDLIRLLVRREQEKVREQNSEDKIREAE